MPQDDWDQDLPRRFLERDPQATAAVERFVSQVVGVWWGGRIPHDHRGDVVQEALISLFGALPSTGLVFRKDVKAFIRHITYARCVDWARKELRPETVSETWDGLTMPSAEKELLSKERLKVWPDVLARLGAGCIELMNLHAVEHLTYPQIAERLGQSERALRVKMCHCLKRAVQLRKDLESGGHAVAG